MPKSLIAVLRECEKKGVVMTIELYKKYSEMKMVWRVSYGNSSNYVPLSDLASFIRRNVLEKE